MASTFANAHTAWRVRTDGNELNGGGFDSSVASAGTDYTDQASPQVNSTTGTCTVASTTWTDTGATFTAAMIGNVLRISAKTGGDATAIDYFVITAYTDANNVTLDRSPCATANITAATYRIGGAHASLASYATSATGLPTPTLSTPLIPGNRIYLRGAGTLDPGSVDYNYSAGKWVMPSGNKTAGGGGVITLIGYNGRPRIDHCGQLITAHWDCKHVSFYRSANTYAYPIFDGSSFAVNCTMTDCIINTNGFDVTEWYAQYGGFLYNEVRNTGGGAAGTAVAVALQHPSAAVIGNYIHDVRGHAIAVQYASQITTTFATIAYNTIVNNLGDGIQINSTSPANPTAYAFAVFNNTINANGGHGINISATMMSFLTCFNNIVSNHVGSGKKGINFADTLTTNTRLQRHPFDANCYYGNTTDWANWAYQTNDIQANPGYVSAAGGNYGTGSAVRSKGLSGLGGVGGTLGTGVSLVNIGAWQGASAGASSGILPYWNPPFYSRMTGNLQG